MPISTPSWHDSLRLTGVTSTAVVATSLLIGALIITIIVFCPRRGIIVVGEGGWGRVNYRRSIHIFGAGSLLLVYLLFIGVAKDDDLAVTGWPQDSTVELTKGSLGKLKVMRSSSDEILLIRRWR
jgi:hypothetical protein